MRRRTRIGTFAALTALLLFSGCPGPVYETSKIRAIKAEAEQLRAAHPTRRGERWIEIPRSEWPPAIASLQPETVFLRAGQVHISIVPFFDGGWGYEIPPAEEERAISAECYLALGEGVFWHDPC